MFLTKLTRNKKCEILTILPQIRGVNAFKSAVIDNDEDRSSGSGEEEEEDKFACFTLDKGESPEKQKEEDKASKRNKKRRDSVDAPEEICIIPGRGRKEAMENKSNEKSKTKPSQRSPRQAGRAISAREQLRLGIKKK